MIRHSINKLKKISHQITINYRNKLFEYTKYRNYSIFNCKIKSEYYIDTYQTIVVPVELTNQIPNQCHSFDIAYNNLYEIKERENINDCYIKEEIQLGNRNARKPKKANHGKRPCSRYTRRAKRRRYGNPRR